MADILDAIWGNKVVTGEEPAKKPELIAFKNSDLAIRMIYKHIYGSKNIVIHCDVDMDGIGSGYIFGRFLATQTKVNPLYIINKDKVHGIQQKHVDYFKDKEIDLLVIVDSSSNDLEIIKQFNCDVLVIDHHEVLHNELCGYTNDGKHIFVIVNNVISNFEIDAIKVLLANGNKTAADKLAIYEADSRMSCGLVVYELLRLYCETLQLGPILENLRLYQWAGVTLYTDAIMLNTMRNQWYVENTVHSVEIEETFRQIVEQVNPYKVVLDKSLISYTIAPIVNKAIRAGASGEALNTIIFNPTKILELNKYRDAQDVAIEQGIAGAEIHESYVLRDISNTNIHKNYNGVVAGKLCDEYNRNAVVFSVVDGIAQGSFRGRMSGVDYRDCLASYDDTTWAQGHKTAFGFKCPIEKLNEVMANLTTVEHELDTTPLVTAGRLNSTEPGKFLIDNIEDFKKQGGIWKLGTGNSKLNSEEQIFITVSSADAVLEEQIGKLYIYNVLGLRCKAFEPVTKPVINIYVEYSRQIECYIK